MSKLFWKIYQNLENGQKFVLSSTFSQNQMNRYQNFKTKILQDDPGQVAFLELSEASKIFVHVFQS